MLLARSTIGQLYRAYSDDGIKPFVGELPRDFATADYSTAAMLAAMTPEADLTVVFTLPIAAAWE